MLICLMKIVVLSYNKVCSQILSSNFVPLNNILSPYKQKEKSKKKKFYLTKILKKNVTCSIDNEIIMHRFQNKKIHRRKL